MNTTQIKMLQLLEVKHNYKRESKKKDKPKYRTWSSHLSQLCATTGSLSQQTTREGKLLFLDLDPSGHKGSSP